jgi:SAM-dependent methyltransferase
MSSVIETKNPAGVEMRSSRRWLEHELRAFGSSLADNAIVLDAGSGDQRYAPYFSRQRYESADFESVDKVYVKSTYVCDLAEIPVDDGRFDAVLFTQVMEHLPDPAIVLKELHRILRPGGRLFFTAPLWYQEHEIPYDFYRYTQYGVRHLFGATGFNIDEMRWLEGYMGTVAHQLRLMKKHLPRHAKHYGGGMRGIFSNFAFGVLRFAIPALYRLSNSADARIRYTDGGLPKNYLAIMTKR